MYQVNNSQCLTNAQNRYYITMIPEVQMETTAFVATIGEAVFNHCVRNFFSFSLKVCSTFTCPTYLLVYKSGSNIKVQ